LLVHPRSDQQVRSEVTIISHEDLSDCLPIKSNKP
jgi:hypothetical protein